MRLGSWFVLIFVLLSGCSRVKIHDDLWCVDTGKFGAECFYNISNEEVTLDKWEWDKLRTGQTCSATKEPSLGFLHLRTALEKLCADSRKCTKEQREIINDAIKGATYIQKKAFRAYNRAMVKIE